MCNSITIHVCGGLGNQMFQYAFGRSLALQHSTPLFLDLTWFENITNGTDRKFALGYFPYLQSGQGPWIVCPENHRIAITYRPFWCKVIEKLGFKVRRYIREKTPMKFQQIKFPLPAYFEGYWQDEKYFYPYAMQIRKDFTFSSLPEPAAVVAEDIGRHKNAVSLHIRRGDYASNPDVQNVHGLCSPQYYQNAITYLKKNVGDLASLKIYLFSDDPLWVQENFDTYGVPSHVIDLHTEADAHHDMHLMSLCTHHIIANSSFSWWGAWLGERGRVIAPQRWFASQEMQQYSPVPERWLKL